MRLCLSLMLALSCVFVECSKLTTTEMPRVTTKNKYVTKKAEKGVKYQKLIEKIAESRGFKPDEILRTARLGTQKYRYGRTITIGMMYRVTAGFRCMMYLFFADKLRYRNLTQLQCLCQ